MTDAEFSVILEAVVAQTGVEAFRTKCDPSHADYVPGMRESVILLHRGEKRPPKPKPPTLIDVPPLAGQPDPAFLARREAIQRQRALQIWARDCLYHERDSGCGCNGVKCWARRGSGLKPDRASLRDCEACLAGLVGFDRPVIEPPRSSSS
jgi:hypothetical protein